MMVAPAAAATLHTETAHASYAAKWVQTGDGKWHVALGYKIPHDTLQFYLPGRGSHLYRPYVGGVNLWIAGNMPDHTNPQDWDYYSRTQISSGYDKLELLVPKTYVIAMYAIQENNWQNEIYITYYRRY